MASAGAGIGLQFCHSLTLTDLQRRPTAVNVLQDRNLLIIGSQGGISTHDISANTRLSMVPIPRNHTPKIIHVLNSKAQVIVVCLEWTVYTVGLNGGGCTCVMDLTTMKRKPLANPLLCFLEASSTKVLFVTDKLKENLRMAYLQPPPPDAQQKVKREYTSGLKVNIEKGKGVVALAAHPYAPVLMVLTSNGELQLYLHHPGAAQLEPIVQFTMLLQESKTPSPLVVGAHLSTAPCPYVPKAAFIFVFLPRLSIFYIMTHIPSEVPKPFMRIPWAGVNQVLTVEIAQDLNSLIAIAGNASVECTYKLRAWTIVGESGCSVSGLKLLPRACTQKVDVVQNMAQGQHEQDQPDWAPLWNGTFLVEHPSTQSGLLDLSSAAHRQKPSAAALSVPHRAFTLPMTHMLAVRYVSRSASQPPFVPIAVFRFVDLDHPTVHHPSGWVGAAHTSPLAWHPGDVDGMPVQLLQHAMPLLRGHQLCGFFEATQDTRLLRNLPVKDTQQRMVTLDMIEYSAMQHVCLLFGAVSEDPAQRVFTLVDVSGSKDASDAVADYQTGIMGVFLGPYEDTFAVLTSSQLGGDNIAIYSSGADFGEDSLLGHTYLELGTGDSITTIWRGPPAAHLLEEPQFDEDGNVAEEEEVPGQGLLLVGTRLGSLTMVLVPVMDETADGDEMVPCTQQYNIVLGQGEHVLQVCWNTLVLPQQVGFPSHCLGGILTTQRVMIVNGHLRMLASVPIAEPELAVPHTITSLLWVGPALLMCHAGGRVEHVMLNNKRVNVCAFAPLGTSVLMSAVGDRLNLVQERAGGKRVVVTRKMYAAGVIAQAWLAMLETGHAYGTWTNVRVELQQLVKHFNLQVSSDASMAQALLAGGCGDLVQKCTQFVGGESELRRCALATASNEWETATEQVLQLYRQSAYAPAPPPEGSKIRQVMTTVSLGAMSQGKWACAAKCLEAAGETLLLMLLYALQHNRRALQQAVTETTSSTAMHTLAMLLLAADARIGIRNELQKDWHLGRPVQDTEASTWLFTDGLVPSMKAHVNRLLRQDIVTEAGEEGPVSQLYAGGLEAHIGLTHKEMLESAPVMAEPAPSREVTTKVDSGPLDTPQAEMTEEEKEAIRVRERFLAEFQADSTLLDQLGMADMGEDGQGPLVSIAQEEEEEEEDDGTNLDERNMRKAVRKGKAPRSKPGLNTTDAKPEDKALGPPGSVPLRKVGQPKTPAETPTSADAWLDLGLLRPDDGAAEPEEPDDPFAAFQGMALPSPAPHKEGASQEDPALETPAVSEPRPEEQGQPAEQPRPMGSGQPTIPEDESDDEAHAPQVAAEGAEEQVIEERAVAVPVQVNASSMPGFLAGVQAMFSGQWSAAWSQFAQAFQASLGDVKRQVAQYAATVAILESYAVVSDYEACRLSRYASFMPLMLLDHASFLVNDGVTRNVRIQNFTWAAQRMEAFVQHCLACGRQDVAQGAAALLQHVKNAGEGNATVPDTEDIPAFVARVNAAHTMNDIASLAANLRAGLV